MPRKEGKIASSGEGNKAEKGRNGNISPLLFLRKKRAERDTFFEEL